MEIGGFDLDKKAEEIKKEVNDAVLATEILLKLKPNMDDDAKRHINYLLGTLSKIGQYSQEQTKGLNDIAQLNNKLKQACSVLKQRLEGASGLN